MLIDRGDVFDADVGRAGAHPVVVVSRQTTIPLRTNVTTVLVTSVIRGHAAEVPLDSTHGLDRECVANCDEIHTIPKRALVRRRGTLDIERMDKIDDAIRLSLGLDEPLLEP